MQVLETGSTKSSDQSDEIDLLKTPRKRPSSLTGITDRIRTGHGTMFVTINFDEEGNPFEVFANLCPVRGQSAARRCPTAFAPPSCRNFAAPAL